MKDENGANAIIDVNQIEVFEAEQHADQPQDDTVNMQTPSAQRQQRQAMSNQFRSAAQKPPPVATSQSSAIHEFKLARAFKPIGGISNSQPFQRPAGLRYSGPVEPGFCSRSVIPPAGAGEEDRILSPSGANSGQVMPALRSVHGSDPRLGNQTSALGRQQALRQTVKVIQIKPPESDEEHYSFDSKDLANNQNQAVMTTNQDKNLSIKPFKVADCTPADELEDDMVQPEAPLQEEPMPEQKSFKSHKQKMRFAMQNFEMRNSLKINNAADVRASNEFNMTPHEMMNLKQPSAHDDPPIGMMDQSPMSLVPSLKTSNIQSLQGAAVAQQQQQLQQQNPPPYLQIPPIQQVAIQEEEYQPAGLPAAAAAGGALKVTATKKEEEEEEKKEHQRQPELMNDLDASRKQPQEDEEEEDESEEYNDVQFPQDNLFTNVNEADKLQRSPGFVIANEKNDNVLVGGVGGVGVGGPPQMDLIMPNGNNASYVKLKQELEDSNIYFLNQLKREVDGEDHFSRLYFDAKPENDQTSFPCISAFITNQNTQNNANFPQHHQLDRKHSTPNAVFQQNLIELATKSGGVGGNIHPNQQNYQLQSKSQVGSLKSAKPAASRINMMNPLMQYQHQQWQQSDRNSFLLENNIQRERDIDVLERSIAVNSADFGESKLLTTERKVLMQAEFGKESDKLQNGSWLQSKINIAKPNETIQLQSTTYKFHSLFISNPVTLIGQPETILEVDGGSIFIDFRRSSLERQQSADMSPLGAMGARNETEDQMIAPSTPIPINRTSCDQNGQFSSVTAAEMLKHHPLNRGTPLTIKKNKVARIQVCEIRYNRTKASIQSEISKQQTGGAGLAQSPKQNNSARPKHARATSPMATGVTAFAHLDTDQQQFSNEISLGATQNLQNLQQPSQTINMMNTSNTRREACESGIQQEVKQQMPQQTGPVSCFVVEHNSYIEVKDCCIKSVKDKKNFDQELDQFFRGGAKNTTANMTVSGQQQSLTGGEQVDFLEQMRIKDNEIRDYCFTLNLPDELTGRASVSEYYGLVSLCSTTIQNFMYGVYCGEDAILTCESSSFIALRAGGCAVKSYCPKMLKVMHGTIQKCESHGIQVTLDEITSSPQAQNMPGQASLSMKRSQYRHCNSSMAAGTPLETLQNQRQSTVSRYEALATEVSPQDNYEDGEDAFTTQLQRLTRKVYIENNRVVQVQGCPIQVEGPKDEHYIQYLVKVKDNRIQSCGLESKLYAIPGATEQEKEEEKIQQKQAYSRIGGPPRACIMLANLHISELSCYRNTISKGSGSGITIYNVKANKEDTRQAAVFNQMINGEAASAIYFPKTEAEAKQVFKRCVGDHKRVTLIDNYVVETSEGYGMIIDQSSCHLELNQLKKNVLGGLLITSSSTFISPPQSTSNQAAMTYNKSNYIHQMAANNRSEKINSQRRFSVEDEMVIAEEPLDTARSFGKEDNKEAPVLFADGSRKRSKLGSIYEAQQRQNQLRLDLLKQFCTVTIDETHAVNNQKFGLGVIGFNGIIKIKKTQCSENETDGMVFAKDPHNPSLYLRGENMDDCAQVLDYAADCTELAKNNPSKRRSRSPQLGIVEGKNNSTLSKQYFVDSAAGVTDPVSIASERPFDKFIGRVQLFQCNMQQNRLDGLKIIDYNVQAFGCTVQGNINSAVRLFSQDDAELEVFHKQRNMDNDNILGTILMGQNSSRYKYRIKVDPNLPNAFKQSRKELKRQIYQELISLNNLSSLADNSNRAVAGAAGYHQMQSQQSNSIYSKDAPTINRDTATGYTPNEKKLLSPTLKQQIDHQSQVQAGAASGSGPQKRKGFFASLMCCVCKTSSSQNNNNISNSARGIQNSNYQKPIQNKHK